MKKTFTGPSQREAQAKADDWWKVKKDCERCCKPKLQRATRDRLSILPTVGLLPSIFENKNSN